MTDTPPDTPSPADAFLAMAAKISRNLPEDFGGAFVLVSPDGSPVEMLILDSRKDPVAFWATASSVIKQVIDNLSAPTSAWGRR